jgi:hypothetical protein
MPALSLAANALITVEEFKFFRGIPSEEPSSADADIQVIAAINGTSQAVRDHLGRHVIATASVVDEFSGDGERKYFVEHCRITDTPVIQYYTGGGVWTTLDSTIYRRYVNDEKGLIEFTDGDLFSESLRYRVTYSTGWALASVPYSIKQAVVQLVERQLQKLDTAQPKEGHDSQSFGDSTISNNLSKWPTDVLDLLRPYRRMTIA